MAHVIDLADVPEIRISAGRWQPLNERLGVTHFGINGTVLDPGEDPDIDHTESEGGGGEQEVYIVVAGRARFRLGDEHVDVGPGTVVAVPDPNEMRGYRALEPNTRIVCIGAGSGAEHDYGGWIQRERDAES
jgi:mannose-6-phosphate isomerase-like protein (cupin superfamily)